MAYIAVLSVDEPLKALAPIIPLFLIVTFVKPVHFWNAYLPIDVTSGFTVKFCIFVHLAKADSSIRPTLLIT